MKNPSKERWEVCEIVLEWHHAASWLDWEWYDRSHFKAIAIGPSGKYIAATSKLFAQENISDTIAAHADLVKRLVQDAWEPSEGSTTAGFNCKFWRNAPRVNSEVSAISERVRYLIQQGKKIEAIKEYRAETGVGLAEAKDVIDQIATGQ